MRPRPSITFQLIDQVVSVKLMHPVVCWKFVVPFSERGLLIVSWHPVRLTSVHVAIFFTRLESFGLSFFPYRLRLLSTY